MNFKITFPNDPISCLIALFGLLVVLIVEFFLAFFFVLPVAALTVAAILIYRHHRLQLMKAEDKLPATIQDRSHYQTPGEFYDIVRGNKLLAGAEEETELYSCEPLADAFAQIITELYTDESFHEPPPRPQTSDRITIGRYYDQLEQWQRKVSDESNLDVFLNTVGGAYIDLRSYFPQYALQRDPEPPRASPFTTALKLSDDEAAGKALIGWFFDAEVKKRKLFERLRDQIQANDEAPKEISFDAHFAKTPFKSLTRVQIPVQLPDETRFAGMWVCAPQGTGKTTLLHALLSGDIEKDASIILLDSKGDLIEPFLSHPMLAGRRVIVGPDNPVGLNPLDIPHTDINKAVESLEYLFSSLVDFKLTGTQSMLLKAVLRSLITVFPNPTLSTFQELLAPHGEKKFAEQIKQLQPDLQTFFANEYNTENIRARRQEVLQRLRSLLDHDLLRAMFLAPKTTFRISEAMDQGAIVIINNSRGRLGNKGAEFFGRFFVAQVLSAAQERSFREAGEKKPVYFYIDEAHTVVAQDERITDVLHECRSQKVALCVSHQETTQLSEKVLSAFQNCAIRISNPDEEARRMAISLRMEPRRLQTLKRGQFGAYVRGLAKTGIVIDVHKVDLSDLRPSLQPYRAKQLPPPAPALVSEIDEEGPEPPPDPVPPPAPNPPPRSEASEKPKTPDAAAEWPMD